MRETCARALAAALMTAAIATAVGLPAAFESASPRERGLTAPPSSLQRTVRVPAGTVRERAHHTLRPAFHQSRRASVTTGTRNVRHVLAPRVVTSRSHSAPSRGPAPAPQPQPTPAPAGAPPPVETPVAAPASTDTTRELTSTTPAPAVEPKAPPPPVTDESEPEKDKGDKDKGKEKKDKEHGRGHGKED
jgi:hypothetical protein